MSNYKSVFAITLIVIGVVCFGDDDDERFDFGRRGDQPALKVTYELWYNTSQLGPVSTSCGEYYATTFLENFYKLESDIQGFCTDRFKNLRVKIYITARVRIFANQTLLSDSCAGKALECVDCVQDNETNTTTPYDAWNWTTSEPPTTQTESPSTLTDPLPTRTLEYPTRLTEDLPILPFTTKTTSQEDSDRADPFTLKRKKKSILSPRSTPSTTPPSLDDLVGNATANPNILNETLGEEPWKINLVPDVNCTINSTNQTQGEYNFNWTYIEDQKPPIFMLVELHTYLNISEGNREQIKRCNETLATQLADISEMDDAETILEIDGLDDARNCSAADLILPRSLHPTTSQWVCPIGFFYDQGKMTCEDKQATDPPVDLSSHRPTHDRPTPTLPQTPTTTARKPDGTTGSTQTPPETTTIRQDTTTTKSDETTTWNNIHTTDTTGGISSTASQTSTVIPDITTRGSTVEDLQSTPLPDNPHWDLELINEDEVFRIAEGDPSTALAFRPTFNKSALCADEKDCQLYIKVTIANGSAKPPRCRDSVGIPQIVAVKDDIDIDNLCRIPLRESMNSVEQILPVIATIDGKYDGTQDPTLKLSLSMEKRGKTEILEETRFQLQFSVEDKDKKSTCQSINDPHITTFDGLEYNNFYHGEFVLYEHKQLPFKVHTLYQNCSKNVSASCNCAVAVQSGDDVWVIDRCLKLKRPFNRIGVTNSSRLSDPPPIMSTRLYLNGDLTHGTKFYQDEDGKKYYVYLPHGASVKVAVNEDLLNVWVVPSPNDINQTKGLCGSYDWDKNNDLLLKNGSNKDQEMIQKKLEETNGTERGQPRSFVKDWRVTYGQAGSIFKGVSVDDKAEYKPKVYCVCEEMGRDPVCGEGLNIQTCDINQVINVIDITERMVNQSTTPSNGRQRKRRNVHDNNAEVIKYDEPIINTNYVPQDFSSGEPFDYIKASNYCTEYIKDNPLGKACEKVPSVNFEKEINTCIEDIRITNSNDWASSAKDAMKEQCWEELQKNESIANEVIKSVESEMCPRDCSEHGDCADGLCNCEINFTGSDCSIKMNSPPYISEMPNRGLCNTLEMDCGKVIVYGNNFYKSDNLKCQLKNVTLPTNGQPFSSEGKPSFENATFLNFGAVECPIPTEHSYLVSVSNDGENWSDPLLFIPYDPRCKNCNTNDTKCELTKENGCLMNHKCYGKNELSPNSCYRCQLVDGKMEWVDSNNSSNACKIPTNNNDFPAWLVAVVAAIAGSLIGLMVGFLLYKCCCRSKKSSRERDYRSDNYPSPYEDTMLHRNRGLPAFASPESYSQSLHRNDYDETHFHNDGRGVENGLDDKTYF